MGQKISLIALVASSFVLSACGGGAGNGTGTGSAMTSYSGRSYVSGPLDAAQSPLSAQVFSQLASATAGTPLNGVVTCGNQIVTFDALDILDSVAVGLQDTAATQNPAAIANIAPNVQNQVTQLAADLQTLLGTLNGGTGCSSSNVGSFGGGAPTTRPSIPTGNPLAGTPLAPLGDALAPVLAQIQAQSAGSGGGSGDAQLTSVATTVSLLANAFNNGLAQVPAQARTAPIVGGVLTTIGTSLTDISRLLNVALAYQGASTAAALNVALYHTLSNVLTQVVPVVFLENQAGTPGAYSTQINSALATASTQLSGGLGTVITPVLETGLRDSLAPALNPIENQVLPAILGPINSALAGAGSSGGSSAGLPPQLTTAAGQVANVLFTLSNAMRGGAGAPCPLAGTPLSAACALIP